MTSIAIDSHEQLCMARMTNEKIALRFGDNRHNFHVELRCNKPVIPGNNVCGICIYRSPTYHTHGSRRFDHGLVNEPIPDHSHIFGGKWYTKRIADYGEPSQLSINKASEYQQHARGDYVVIQPSYKDETIYSDKASMPPKKRAPAKLLELNTELNNDTSPLLEQKQSEQKQSEQKQDEQQKEIKKRGRKPKVTPPAPPSPSSSSSSASSIPSSLSSSTKTRPKQTKRRPKKSTLASEIETNQEVNQNEICIATNIEDNIEQVDINGLDIVYVQLKSIDIHNSSYYIDHNKNKLYEKLENNKIGKYMGRYDSINTNIVVDVPDSDEE